MKKSIFIAFASLTICSIISCQSNMVTEESDVITQLSEPNNKAACIFLTKDEKGQAAISWIEIDSNDYKSFFYSTYNLEKREFNKPRPIPIDQNASINEEGMPKIAFKGDGSVFVIYETKEAIEGSKWGLSDVKYLQSFDEGKTWTNPQSIAIEDYNNKQSSSFANLSRLADGEIGICWLGSGETKGRPVNFAKTKGKNLSKIITIDEQACECCRTAISSSKNGHISIAYRDLLEGSIRDISIAQSFDNGESFEKAIPFSQDDWMVEGCPHAGPSIYSFDQNTFVSWFTDAESAKGVNYAKLDSSGQMIFKQNISSNGHFNHLDILSNETAIISYSEGYNQENAIYRRVMLAKFEDNLLTKTEVTPPLVQANFPVVKVLNKEEVLVAWIDEDQAYYTIQKIKNINKQTIDNSPLAVHYTYH